MDGFYRFGGKGKNNSFVQFWNKNPFFLHIGILPDFSGRIELRGSSAVAITAGDEGTFLVIGQIFAIDFN